MSKQEKPTESKLGETIKGLVREAKMLEHDEKEKLRRANRKDTIFFGVFAVFYLVLIVIAIATGKWASLILPIAFLVWTGLVTMQNRLINDQRYTLNMLIGLRKLEGKAQEQLKEKSSGSTNAASNRKK